MYRVNCQIDFCYGHRLLNYPGKCRHLHGHNGRVVIGFTSDHLNELGMVLDFTEIKQVVGAWIDDNLDHRMILHQQDPVVAPLAELGELMFLVSENPTAEYIAKLIHDAALSCGIPVASVELWETPRCSATYFDPKAGTLPGRGC